MIGKGECMVPIRENLLSPAKYNLKCPAEATAKDMKYIVVHNTANDASAANEVAYMIRNDSPTSFNAAVDDKEIVIGIPLDKGAFAAGQRDGNAYGIHIEICYSLSGGAKFDKAEKNAAEYIARLLKERKWDTSHIKKHQDFDGKYCPHRTLDKGWARFIKMIESALNNKADEKPETKPIPKQIYRVRTSWSDAKSQIGAYKSLENAKNACPAGYKVYASNGKVVYEPFKAYTVRRNSEDPLNIRTGPGTNFDVQGQITDRKRSTITEERTGEGSAKGWGKLKAGGWIALDWVKRV